jgi:hypothetical protein
MLPWGAGLGLPLGGPGGFRGLGLRPGQAGSHLLLPGGVPSPAVSGTYRDHWRASPDTDIRYTNLFAVSCPTRKFCAAVGFYSNAAGTESFPLAEMWNGTSWKVQVLPPKGNLFATMYGVSCPSSSFCEAVGYGAVGTELYPEAVAEVWNGTAWKRQSTPQPTNGSYTLLSGVSCTSTTFCEAVGEYIVGADYVTLAESWNGTKWVLQPTPPGLTKFSERVFTAVSCTSPSFCEAVGIQTADILNSAFTLANTWNGTKWSRQAVPNPVGLNYNELYGVSCAGSRFCEAVGSHPPAQGSFATFAESWGGTKWALQQTVPTLPGGSRGGSLAVSCPTTRSCEAVGWGSAMAESWNGTKWTVQAAPSPTDSAAELLGVSCPSSGSCEAVGNYSNTSGDKTLGEGWNGTKWAIQTTPNP